jgi:zinc transport system substrate-binding protein
MNRIILLTISTSIIFAVSLRAGDNQTKKDHIILTSFYPMYIMALNIAEGIPDIKVVNMTKPQTGCLHEYQLTPQDLKTISNAWVFVVSGKIEPFLDKVIMQQPSLKIINAGKGIELIKGNGNEGENPHVWVSVSNAITQVKTIVSDLVTVDPANGSQYKVNGDAYVKKLEVLRTKMHEGLKDISSQDIITFHEAFPYFAKEFNLHIVAVIEREPGSEPSARELAETIRIVKQNKVKALFAEPQYPTKAALTIARETGVNVFTLDPAVTGPQTPDSYIRTMESNLTVLQKALK